MCGSGVQRRSLARDRDLGVTGICLVVKTTDVTETAQGKKLKRGDERTSLPLRYQHFLCLMCEEEQRIQTRRPDGAGDVTLLSLRGSISVLLARNGRKKLPCPPC